MNPIKWLFGVDRALCKTEEFLLTITLIVMLVFASLQVILRNFFDTGVEWGDVFARHLVLWVGFFGATLATKKDLHIRIDALTKVMPKKILPLIEMVIASFCIVIGALLTHAAYKFVNDERMMATVLFEGIPTWYFITIMPAGFGLVTFRYVVKLLEICVKLVTGEEPVEPATVAVPGVPFEDPDLEPTQS